MSEFWCIVDVPNVAHRAFWVMGGLTHGGEGTGAIYGTFRTIAALRDSYVPDRFVFCFDRAPYIRRSMCPEYKASRAKRLDAGSRRAFDDLRGQIDRLYGWWLRAVGYRNVFRRKGFEADDLVAQACLQLPDDAKAIVISSDSDLLQLLSDRVTVWNSAKKRQLTEANFVREWNLRPASWAEVKAIAGCSSDEILGVRGVGERTAAKYLAGTLGSGTKAYERIRASRDLIARNLALTRLPLEGTEPLDLVSDRVTSARWDSVMDRLGIMSLRRRERRERA